MESIFRSRLRMALPRSATGSPGFNCSCTIFSFFQKISIPENKNNTTEGIDGHDTCQEKSQVTVVDTHAVMCSSFTAHIVNFCSKEKERKIHCETDQEYYLQKKEYRCWSLRILLPADVWMHEK
ncbi:MAG: hypothetical protein ACKOU7_05200 [Ferruginibacter sp.]